MQFKSSLFKVKEVLKLRIGCLEPIFRWSKFDKGSPWNYFWRGQSSQSSPGQRHFSSSKSTAPFDWSPVNAHLTARWRIRCWSHLCCIGLAVTWESDAVHVALFAHLEIKIPKCNVDPNELTLALLESELPSKPGLVPLSCNALHKRSLKSFRLLQWSYDI